MPRKGISKKEVIASIHQLIEKKEVPTAIGIRHLLGRGSLTTIQKHFRNWNFTSHRMAAENLKPGLSAVSEKNSAEIRLLEQKLMETEEQQQMLSQELIKKEQENVKLSQENLKFNQNLAEITETHKVL